MGNLCTGQSAVESRRKQQRAGSGSTTGFSPTEDPGHVKNGSVAPGVTSGSAMPASSRGQAPGEGAEVSAPDMEVDEYHQAHQKQSLEQDSRESSREINPRPSTGNNERGSQHEGRHRRHSSRERNAPPTAGGEATHQEATGDPRVGRNAGPGATGSADDGESGEDRSEKGDHERRHRDRSKDGEQRRARNGSHRHSHKSRPSGGSVKEGSKEGAGGQPRTRDRDRDKDGDHRGSSSRTRRGSDRGTHGEQGSSRRNDRPEGNTGESGRRRQSRGGDPAESEEARRERRERRERKRKAKEAAAAAAAATTRGRGGEGAVDEAPVGGSSRRSSASNATGDAFQGSSDGKSREKKSRRKEVAGATSETRADGDAREDAVGEGGKAPPYTEVVEGVFGAATGETGSGTAVAAVVAAPVVVAEAIVVNERKGKKGSSSFKQVYDSLTGGFSGSAAQQAAGAAAGGSGGGAGGGGGGPAGGGGGGGGGTNSSTKSSSKSKSSSARNQLVTTVTSRDVREKYEIERSQLGHGHYGVVRRCWDKKTREGFAIKTIKKSKVNRIESLRREIDILRCVDHPCIIKLYDVYEDERFIHLVTELCTGGELFDRIIQKTESEEGHYSEKDAKVVVASILSGIEYCHNEHNICHRDLKPENFLFKRPDSDTEIKIIDFGLSRFEDMQTAMTTRVGTPYYIAPEVLSRKYDKACDLWSIGVITYILLAGYPPFYGESDQEIFASVRHGYFDFPSPEWDKISDEAKDFITQLLQKDPSARMTASESLRHRWFNEEDAGVIQAGAANRPGDALASAEEDSKDKLGTQVSMQRINHRLRRFVGMSKLKKVALNVIAQQLTEVEIGHLRGVFERLDVEGNGVISVNELEKVVQQEGLGSLQDDVVRLLQGIDIDGSNSLNYREFLAATMERNIFIREENIRCAFEYFDLDGKSQITLANLVKIFGAEEHAREIMGDVKLADDGVINYEEFKNMMMEMPLDGRDPMTPRTPRTPFVRN